MVEAPSAVAVLDATAVAFADCPWEAEVLKEAVAAAGAAVDLKLGKAQAPVRVAVTGRTVGPPLFETMAECMERQEVLRRIARARARL
jgi:glutamyl-tRNA synthetase